MRLSFIQLQGLDRLRSMPEFVLLLDAIQADIDDLADAIESARTDEEERRAVSEWRALRSCLRRLRGIPESLSSEAAELREALGPSQAPPPADQEESEILARALGLRPYHAHEGPGPEDLG